MNNGARSESELSAISGAAIGAEVGALISAMFWGGFAYTRASTSDRRRAITNASCRTPLTNQMRLILHTAAYWLMLDLRDAIPKTHPLAVAEFVTLREKILKIGARIVETVSRIKLAFATACPQAGLFRHLAGALQPAGP